MKLTLKEIADKAENYANTMESVWGMKSALLILAGNVRDAQRTVGEAERESILHLGESHGYDLGRKAGFQEGLDVAAIAADSHGCEHVGRYIRALASPPKAPEPAPCTNCGHLYAPTKEYEIACPHKRSGTAAPPSPRESAPAKCGGCGHAVTEHKAHGCWHKDAGKPYCTCMDPRVSTVPGGDK